MQPIASAITKVTFENNCTLVYLLSYVDPPEHPYILEQLFCTMDDEIAINPEDINRLSDREKNELRIFLQGESQKAQVQKRRFLSYSLSIACVPSFLSTSFVWLLFLLMNLN